ncbi:histidine kinase [Rheinheimera sp. WS51]|uniref:histidine kinase n=1 Tax=Rheinheimera sp. WS51 TaxID=3425886 RepID=UPI003D8C5C28
MQKFSIVTRISVALACIVSLAIATILVSFWLSDKLDSHAQAINTAGSLRMQTYRLGWLAVEANNLQLEAAIENIQLSWQNAIFKRVIQDNAEITPLYYQAEQQWQQLLPLLSQLTYSDLTMQLEQHIKQLNELVLAIQHDAEHKVRTLRSVQLIALLLTVMLALIITHWLKVKVEQPLIELTRAARRIGHGDFTVRVTPQQPDELGLFAETLNKMNDAIGHMYGNLEQRVDKQTKKLQHQNTRLNFLYTISRRMSESVPQHKDFQQIIDALKSITQLDNIELCLVTEQGQQPYFQVQPGANEIDPCQELDCSDCLSTKTIKNCDNLLIYNYPLNRDKRNFGVLVARKESNHALEQWQQDLLNSVADLMAIALSLKTEEEQIRRLALMQERTVIARELHDSLAQALSYLKIQVARLNKALVKQDQATIDDVKIELKQGLDSAYRQLRELLTTFRLKIDGTGLLDALHTTVKQLMEQSSLLIKLDYQLVSVPLAPNEEVHLLQIIREASQNAIHHSQGSLLQITLLQQADKSIYLAIEDDGVGIDSSPEKLNHYGLAIMQERGKHLGGDLTIKLREEGGTGVYFSFVPSYWQEQNVS